MRREQFTAKLVRMIETIQQGGPPARVREFYVFGSYARGALECGDLDVVVVHDRPPKEYEEAIAREMAGKYSATESIFKAGDRFRADMGRALRKPGEKIEIILVRELKEILGTGSKIRPDDLVLLWSDSDRDFRPKLEAIRPDPAARSAPRDHIISLKRLSDNISTMEKTVAMLHHDELVLDRRPFDGIKCKLNDFHARKLEIWSQLFRMGKASLRLAPYALWWFEQHHQSTGIPDQLEIWSESGTHRVHMGKPSLGGMLYCFEAFPKLERQCLIPHIKKGQPNELLIFERGKQWSQEHLTNERTPAVL